MKTGSIVPWNGEMKNFFGYVCAIYSSSDKWIEKNFIIQNGLYTKLSYRIIDMDKNKKIFLAYNNYFLGHHIYHVAKRVGN